MNKTTSQGQLTSATAPQSRALHSAYSQPPRHNAELWCSYAHARSQQEAPRVELMPVRLTAARLPQIQAAALAASEQ
eukprot:355368-Chlamydomonas_euryale.AAC.3